MIAPAFSPRRLALAVALFSLAAPGLLPADDATPPYVANPIADVTVAAGTAKTKIKFNNTFGLQGVTGTVVRLTTSLGQIDLGLDDADYPLNVANFLAYVNGGKYNNTFVHRVANNPDGTHFVIQAGGYYNAGYNSSTQKMDFRHIAKNGTVKGEHKASNLTGTIAMALTPDPGSADSGTSEWFINLADNTALDSDMSNQGPFTAFGRVIENGMDAVNAIGNTTAYDASSVVVSGDGSADMTAFNELPLINYTTAQGTNVTPDLVNLQNAAVIPIVPLVEGQTAVLAVSVSTTNPGLVTPTINGKKLTLTYTPGQTGTATVTLKAKNPTTKAKVKAKFTVTVQ